MKHYNSPTFLYQIILFLTLFILCGCEDSDKDEEDKYILTILPSDIKFKAQKDTCNFTFTVLKNGKRAENYSLIYKDLKFNLPDWCEFKYNDAQVGGYFGIIAQPNNNESARSVTAEVVYRDLSTTISITQEGASKAKFVKFKSDTIDIGTSINRIGFHIISDGAWNISNIPDWCTVEPDKGNGDDYIYINITNNELKKRQDTDLLFSFSEEKQLHVRLWGKEEVYIHKSSFGLEEDLMMKNLFGSTKTLKLKGPMYVDDFYVFNKLVNLRSLDLSDTYIYGRTGELPSYSISDCSLLETIIFPAETYSIGQSAFSRCISLEHLIIPEKVVKISSYAFFGCNALKRIELPSTLAVIENGVFSSVNLEYIKCKAATPPRLNTTFTSTTYNSATLTVPRGCLDKYKNNSVWNKFKNIVESQD